MVNKYNPYDTKAFKIIRVDSKTKEWIHKHPDQPATIVLCRKCGVHYIPEIGHECKNVR